MDYKNCPLKKRPLVYMYEENTDEIYQIPQDLSLKRKADFDCDDTDDESKKICPLDLSNSSSYVYDENLNFMNPTKWHYPIPSSSIYFEKRCESPISNESITSRSSSVSPTTANPSASITFCNSNKSIGIPYQSDNHSEYYYNPSTYYQTHHPDILEDRSSDTSFEPEDLSVQSYIPLPALNHQISSDSKKSSQQLNRFCCEKCGKSYSTLSGIRKHEKIHCDKLVKHDRFACPECDKKYTTLNALKMHIKTHTPPCKCNICGKAFSRPWLLQGHIRTHTGEKPFVCEFCPKAFADRSNLKSHQQIHMSTKRYSCNQCQITFSRLSLLKQHKIKHCLYVVR